MRMDMGIGTKGRIDGAEDECNHQDIYNERGEVRGFEEAKQERE